MTWRKFYLKNLTMNSQREIEVTIEEIRDLLITKNNAYGNSALEPINVFSNGSAVDSLCARIDDKLARIKNSGLNDVTEDTLLDLSGYMVLLIIAKRNEKGNI
jgi:hypothetical protein